jgi:hypothetical protein
LLLLYCLGSQTAYCCITEGWQKVSSPDTVPTPTAGMGILSPRTGTAEPPSGSLRAYGAPTISGAHAPRTCSLEASTPSSFKGFLGTPQPYRWHPTRCHAQHTRLGCHRHGGEAHLIRPTKSLCSYTRCWDSPAVAGRGNRPSSVPLRVYIPCAQFIRGGAALCEPLCPGLCNVRSYAVEFN